MKESQEQIVMKKVDIPGISVALVNSAGIISTRVMGTIDSTRCGFLKMLAAPTEENQHTFNKSCYILTNKEFLYFNKAKNELQKISLESSQLEALNKSFDKDEIDILSNNQLDEITSITDHIHSSPSELVDKETVFGAASLSKPVFAYLVLKLIEENKYDSEILGVGRFDLDKFKLDKFDLETPLYKILPGLSEGGKNAEKITAKMVLSHTTGIPISSDVNVPEFLFEPGTHYMYCGVPYIYLQMAIEKLTGETLEELAQKFVFRPLGMTHSSFLRSEFSAPSMIPSKKERSAIEDKEGVSDEEWAEKTDIETREGYRKSVVEENILRAKFFPIDLNKFPSISANSLRTTPTDHAKLMVAWMNDKKLRYAFDPVISMTKDYLPNDWPIKVNVQNVDKENVACGLGIVLQLDNEGNAIRAYHWGDMNEWRSWVVANIEDKSVIVYFANSPNGHILAEQIISPHIELTHGFNYFFPTFGFARNLDELEGKTNNHGICPSRAKKPTEEKKNAAKLELSKNEIAPLEEGAETTKTNSITPSR